MAKQRDETGLRPLGMLAGSLVIWIVTFVVSMRVLHTHPESVVVRGAMVVLFTAGFATWVVSVARLILTQDEFSQRVHLIAIAVMCAATSVLLVAGDLLQTAELLGDIPLQGIWMAMGALWWLGIVIATRYYR